MGGTRKNPEKLIGLGGNEKRTRVFKRDIGGGLLKAVLKRRRESASSVGKKVYTDS